MRKLFYTLLLMLLVAPALAQEDDSVFIDAFRALISPELILSGPDGHGDGVVGALPAVVDVSALGGAVYSIPIQVPQGINGMQPDLSVVYNSQSGNGLLGWGWNIGGLSAITRVGSTMYHDNIVDGVDFDEFDRFALDGQRLVVMGDDPYGSNEADYRTEIDGMSKIMSYTAGGIVNGPSRFKVWTLDGKILEYGSTANSRLQFAHGNNMEVGVWLLRTVTDRNGNCITYEYNNDGESVTLNTVYYTSTPDSLGCYSVTFDYDTRDDVELSFIGDHAVKQKHLLNSIHVRRWGQEMWRYDFAYENGVGHSELPDYYNRLSSVTFTCGGVRYNPTQIVWGNRPAITYSNESPAQGDHNYYDYTTQINLNGVAQSGNELVDCFKYSGDFNGDGLADFISVYYTPDNKDAVGEEDLIFRGGESNIKVYLNKGNTKSGAENGIIRFDSVFSVTMTLNEMDSSYHLFNCNQVVHDIMNLKWIYVCDFNGDGLDDFILHRKRYNKVMIHAFKAVLDEHNGLTFVKTSFSGCTTIPYIYQNPDNNEEHLLIGDFMGRGQQDMILVPPRKWNNNPRDFRYFTFIDNNDGGCFTEEIAQSGMKGTVFSTGDFNGDGKTEIWYAFDDEENSGRIVSIYKNSYSNNRYAWESVKEGFLNCDNTVFTGDFNGDGKI